MIYYNNTQGYEKQPTSVSPYLHNCITHSRLRQLFFQILYNLENSLMLRYFDNTAAAYVSAWLSGTWFDLSLVGGAFKTIAYVLPFANAVDATRAALSGNYSDILKPLLIVIAYAIGIFAVAIIVFRKKMNSDN